MSATAEEAAEYLDFIPDNPTELRRAVTRMAAHINVADWRFIKLIAEMNQTCGWQEGGYCNLGNWLDHRCGMGPCAARERIRIGRALARLPRIDAAFRDGALSYSKVRAITRVATPETDAMLLAIAARSSVAQLESLVRTYERVGRDKERVCGEERRSLSWYYEDGMLVITAAVPADRGALLLKALQKVVDVKSDEREAYDQSLLAATNDPGNAVADAAPAAAERENGTAGAAAMAQDGQPQHTPGDVSAEAECPAANGAGDVSAQTLAAADKAGTEKANGEVSVEAERPAVDGAGDVSAETDLPTGLIFQLSSTEQRFGDALVELAEHYLASSSGHWKRRRTGQRYEVTLHIDRNELAERQPGNSARYTVDPDWGVDEQDARQIACDADIEEFIQDERGDILNYERRRRIVPARLLRALKIRDHNRCRFPGCPHQRYVEAHHIRHWIDGGETRLENLVLLCSAHHRLLHHGAFHMAIDDDAVVFISNDGELIETTLQPQFPDVSVETPLDGQRNVDRPLAMRPRKRSVFESRSDRDIVDLLHYRENWRRKRNDRFWNWLHDTINPNAACNGVGPMDQAGGLGLSES